MKTVYVSDEELIESMKQGDESAFGELYHRYKHILVAFTLRKIDAEYVEDIIHDLFAKLWQNRDKLNISSNFRSYVYTALRNRILNQLVKIKNNQKYIHSLREFADNNKCHMSDLLLREDRFYREIEMHLSSFNSMDRTIVKMRLDGFKNQEIAEHLAISEKTVRNHYSIILKTLRQKVHAIVFLYFF